MAFTTGETLEQHRAFVAALLRGALGGFIGGVLMAVAAMCYMVAATPMEFWLPMKNVAATWLGVDALIGGPRAVVIGIVTHLAVATACGFVFGLLVRDRLSFAVILLAGLAYATAIWALMTWIVMPEIDPAMAARNALLPGWWWWVLHAIFGLTLAMVVVSDRE